MTNSEGMIPSVYQQSWDMRTLCRIFDMEFDLIKYYTEHILDCYSPENCPENLLENLAAHIGFDYQQRKSTMYNRIVLKNFIRHLIRYRGSATGIRNAAAIDIRYDEKYPATRFDINTGTFVPDEKAGQTIPMSYYEGLAINKTWMDVDNSAGIIYLFVIVSDYFPSVTAGMTEEERQEAHAERMRKLLDLSYLQEYVRPAGMYLLPMVAEKVDIETDMTVKAVRIRESERGWNNGVKGTPNASMQMKYDRIHFAHLEDGTLNSEPWIRTLYHSQLAGGLQNKYFTAPVYHIDGKFLYYNHDELQTVYENYRRPGREGKIGDSLYNPNVPDANYKYSYGPNSSDEPKPIQDVTYYSYPTETNYEPLAYDDHGVFGTLPRTWQDIPLGVDIPTVQQGGYPTYLVSDADDNGTNKNMMINLFDDEGYDPVQSPYDIIIVDKGPVDRRPVPYEIGEGVNIDMTGDDLYYRFIVEDDEQELIP